ncbi:MAG: hypothetical protein QOC87_416, partial [Actinomycetota bacterium]|nr:hypothetical protein [Actinomycetota bacterium]
MPESASSNVEAVNAFLRAQNLEQLGRADEAVSLYEGIVTGGFDSSGPYDRLIAIYSDRDDHEGVERVATLAIANVRTHPQKVQWYEQVRAGAQTAARQVPRAV